MKRPVYPTGYSEIWIFPQEYKIGRKVVGLHLFTTSRVLTN
jgi:hypothetical protein